MDDLSKLAVTGGAAKVSGQAATLLLRVGFIAVMARLLLPEDFGLVVIVVAVTGVYELFTTAGLSLATVQRLDITEQQTSNLFWINLGVGLLLCLLCAITAPVLVAFYGEPRLFWLTMALSAGFVMNGACVQHSALLQKELRYVELTVIEVASLLASCLVGVGMAAAGSGYWALAGTALAKTGTLCTMTWLASRWVPLPPSRTGDVRALLGFGGTVTLNNLIVHFAYNVDKVLIGYTWGAAAAGVYGTSYQLANVPTTVFLSAVGGVAFSTLSRLQDDRLRLASYFLKGHLLLISIIAPILAFCGVYAHDIILVLLGEQWSDAAGIFQLLVPAMFVLAIVNPTAWLMQSIGLHRRSLFLAAALAPLAVCGYAFGLPYGPKGVALGFSIAMAVWLLPHIFWSLHGTPVSPRKFLFVSARPILAGLIAAGVAYAATMLVALEWPLARLAAAGVVMTAAYTALLLLPIGDRSGYLDLMKDFSRVQPPVGQTPDAGVGS